MRIEFYYAFIFPTGSSSSSSHTNNNNSNNRISSTYKAHDSNSINQNFSSKPYFDLTMPKNVTLKVGETAFLSCRVKQLGDKVVSVVLLCIKKRKFSTFHFPFVMNYFLDNSIIPAIFFNPHSLLFLFLFFVISFLLSF